MQKINLDDVYQRFFKSYKKAHANKKSDNVQKDANLVWTEAKARYGTDTNGFSTFIQQRINHYDTQDKKRKVGLLSYFSKNNYNLVNQKKESEIVTKMITNLAPNHDNTPLPIAKSIDVECTVGNSISSPKAYKKTVFCFKEKN
ncbi:uncharacterized protein LOC111633057 [Centruroides sculpturatus]|uniref:uncharacterized protein LOC111633057 n=1 Tax=Centruroides sculpturatus TaxID=218467 RepID=UPI000C6D153D|nr:uncharacterized protein LOC111633057 [Centruroides sculpturatus]